VMLVLVVDERLRSVLLNLKGKSYREEMGTSTRFVYCRLRKTDNGVLCTASAVLRIIQRARLPMSSSSLPDHSALHPTISRQKTCGQTADNRECNAGHMAHRLSSALLPCPLHVQPARPS
jgi:hypothetical protein